MRKPFDVLAQGLILSGCGRTAIFLTRRQRTVNVPFPSLWVVHRFWPDWHTRRLSASASHSCVCQFIASTTWAMKSSSFHHVVFEREVGVTPGEYRRSALQHCNLLDAANRSSVRSWVPRWMGLAELALFPDRSWLLSCSSPMLSTWNWVSICVLLDLCDKMSYIGVHLSYMFEGAE